MRPAVLLVALALAPAALAAQAPPAAGAADANPIVSAFKASGNYVRWLPQAFDSIPQNLYAYKPTPVQLSVANIAVHLERANYTLCNAIAAAPHAMTARDSTADSVKAGWPKDTLVSRLKASLDFCDAAVNHLTDANLTEPATIFGRQVTKARALVIYYTDLAEHYNQIAGYMRMNNLTPPSAQPRRRM